jgi:short subunit dehydrogenase-like uncharacterized protein
MKTNRTFDVVIYGASGYTGRLVAEHLWNKYGKHQSFKLAIAGRDPEKLQSVKTVLHAGDDLGMLIADAENLGSLINMANNTRLIITTVGPYQFHGTKLVEACASVGTDYLDLCAEPHWIRRMIDIYTAPAKTSGARILFSCGFDSIPSEIGVYSVQEAAKRKIGSYASSVKCLVRQMKGGFSGGTAESLNANLSAAANDENVARLLADPFALTPGFAGPPQPETNTVAFDDDLGVWTAPSMMAFINTRSVHRLNYLLAQRFGEDFLYDERIMTGPGDQGRAAAEAIASAPSPLVGDQAPKPGTGPTEEERNAGSFSLLFVARTDNARLVKVGVQGDRDPGYGATSKMISEAAIALLTQKTACPGGIWTPGAALRDELGVRLTAEAGILVRIED